MKCEGQQYGMPFTGNRDIWLHRWLPRNVAWLLFTGTARTLRKPTEKATLPNSECHVRRYTQSQKTLCASALAKKPHCQSTSLHLWLWHVAFCAYTKKSEFVTDNKCDWRCLLPCFFSVCPLAVTSTYTS